MNAIEHLSPESLAALTSQYLEITHSPFLRRVKDGIDRARALDALVHDRPLPLRDEVDDDRLTGGDLAWALGILLNALEGDNDATQEESREPMPGGRLRTGGQQPRSLSSLLSPDALLVDEDGERAVEAPRPATRVRDVDGDGSR